MLISKKKYSEGARNKLGGGGAKLKIGGSNAPYVPPAGDAPGF